MSPLDSVASHMKKVPIHKIYEASDLSQLLPPIITARQGLTCSGGSTIICNLLLYRFFFAHKPQWMGRLPAQRLSSLVERNIFIWTDYLTSILHILIDPRGSEKYVHCYNRVVGIDSHLIVLYSGFQFHFIQPKHPIRPIKKQLSAVFTPL